MNTINHSISNILPFREAWRGFTFGRAWRGISLLGVLFVSMSFLASCSENDDTTNEWENWQTKNDTYWTNLYAQAQQAVASGDSTWKIIPNWSLSNQKPTTDGATLNYDPTDYIIVHVENKGEGTETPMYTDSVRIHYLGRMIPSPTYTSGFIFDASYNYSEPYNLLTMRPITSTCGSFVSGFTTALLNMHKGDRWTVYIPYNLAYGSTTPTSGSTTSGGVTYSQSTTSDTGLQPYSDLIFDITLVDFYKPGEKVPVAYSKKNAW